MKYVYINSCKSKANMSIKAAYIFDSLFYISAEEQQVLADTNIEILLSNQKVVHYCPLYDLNRLRNFVTK